MRLSKRVAAAVVAGCALIAAAGAEALTLTSVEPVPPKQTGNSVPVMLSRGLAKVIVAQCSDPLDGGTAANPYYGYSGDGPLLPAPGDLPASGHLVEATKTEPDKNTYLVFKRGLRGADDGYYYGSHFLFQGHEGAAGGAS